MTQSQSILISNCTTRFLFIPTSGETEQNELQNLCGKTFSVTSEKVEFLEETDFQVDEDIYCWKVDDELN